VGPRPSFAPTTARATIAMSTASIATTEPLSTAGGAATTFDAPAHSSVSDAQFRGVSEREDDVADSRSSAIPTHSRSRRSKTERFSLPQSVALLGCSIVRRLQMSARLVCLQRISHSLIFLLIPLHSACVSPLVLMRLLSAFRICFRHHPPTHHSLASSHSRARTAACAATAALDGSLVLSSPLQAREYHSRRSEEQAASARSAAPHLLYGRQASGIGAAAR